MGIRIRCGCFMSRVQIITHTSRLSLCLCFSSELCRSVHSPQRLISAVSNEIKRNVFFSPVISGSVSVSSWRKCVDLAKQKWTAIQVMGRFRWRLATVSCPNRTAMENIHFQIYRTATRWTSSLRTLRTRSRWDGLKVRISSARSSHLKSNLQQMQSKLIDEQANKRCPFGLRMH